MKKFRTSALLLSLGLLSACSNSFVYNQLDWLIPWYVDDYVDLSRDQRRDLKSQLQPLLRWHREEELASYVRIIDGIEADLREPLNGLEVEAWANATWQAWERIEARMLPLAFELGEDLSDAQMDEFVALMHKRQLELEEEYLGRSDEEYLADTLEDFSDSLDEFLGRLTEQQIALLETASAALLRFDNAWLEERRLWIERLALMLQRQPGWQQEVMQALETRDANRGEAYRSAYAHNQIIINDAIAAVLNLRTEKQSRRLQGQLDDLRADLEKLIAQAD
ncbi:MAG: DUF6279 family lipoprotein [Halieaceae bacterium]